jgi:hypothetical protein
VGIISQHTVKHGFLARVGGIGGKSPRAGSLFMQNKANL